MTKTTEPIALPLAHARGVTTVLSKEMVEQWLILEVILGCILEYLSMICHK